MDTAVPATFGVSSMERGSFAMKVLRAVQECAAAASPRFLSVWLDRKNPVSFFFVDPSFAVQEPQREEIRTGLGRKKEPNRFTWLCLFPPFGWWVATHKCAASLPPL